MKRTGWRGHQRRIVRSSLHDAKNLASCEKATDHTRSRWPLNTRHPSSVAEEDPLRRCKGTSHKRTVPSELPGCRHTSSQCCWKPKVQNSGAGLGAATFTILSLSLSKYALKQCGVPYNAKLLQGKAATQRTHLAEARVPSSGAKARHVTKSL